MQPLVVLARRLATRHALLAEGDSAAEGAKAGPYTIAPPSGHAPPYTIGGSSQSSGGSVSFRHADMLTADLSAVPHPAHKLICSR